MATSVPSSAEHNTHVTSIIKMEVDTPEYVEEKEQTQQSSSPRLQPENSSSESFTYFQTTINAIVQNQIQGNTAKMLVMLATGEQRLFTFDIPNEDCTVHDLLNQVRAVLGQVNISFPCETKVSLVDDPALGINYLVEADVMHTSSLDGSDGNCNSTQEIVSTIANAEKLSQKNINTSDENSNTSLQTPEVTSNTSSCDKFTMDNEENSKGICENHKFLDIGQLPQIALECRTVTIGSYKYIPRQKVVISHTGVRFSVPLLDDDTSFVTLDVKYRDIVKLLIHFGKTMPVLFFYTSISTGTMIRELLGMQDPKGPYYDPAGKDRTQKHITLLPDKLPDDSKAILASLFSRGNKMGELNFEEANGILIRASPRDMFYKNNSERNVVKLGKIERDGPTCKRPRREGKSAASKPKPIHKEPECLTISSEEEEIKTKKTEVTDREGPKLQEYYTDEKIESLLAENLYLKSQLKRLHSKMSTKDNEKNPSTSHPGPNVEDFKLQEYYTDEKIESLFVENLYLKSKRLHHILKMFSHNPKVAEYLQQHNFK